MAELTEAEVKAIVGRSMGIWYKQVYSKLQAALHKQNLELTGELQNSLHGEISTAGADLQGQLKLYFTDYGRFQDMKFRYTGKMPPFDVMLQYVRKVGVEKFKYVPGYPMGVIPTGISQSKFGAGNRIAENRIAWGLSHSRVAPKNSSKKYGTRKWYAKIFWSSIDELIEMLMGRVKKMTTNEIVNSLKK